MHSTCVYVSAFATAISMEMSLPIVGYIFCKNCILAWGVQPNPRVARVSRIGMPAKLSSMAPRAKLSGQNGNGKTGMGVWFYQRATRCITQLTTRSTGRVRFIILSFGLYTAKLI
jgi:hypothetical protein